MFSRAHTIAAAGLMLALAPPASAQLFGGGGFLQRWNGPEWNMQQPDRLKIPGHGVSLFNRRGTSSPYPTGPQQLYQGPADVSQIPMPQMRNTYDRWQNMVVPGVQGVQNFVQPLPGGQAFSDSLQRHLVKPSGFRYQGSTLPSNLPGVAAVMQNSPGSQFYNQANSIAQQHGATLTPQYSPSALANRFVERGQGMAQDRVMGSVGQLGADAAAFGAQYWPSARNIPNYVNAGRALLGQGGGAAGGAPAQDMPQ
jgi:hypothetical protein